MSILSLYSKIQLKIGKAEGEIKLPPCLDRGFSREKPPSRRRRIVRVAWKLQLLFWKTAKVIVRFFALIFGDSSENYLVFTRVNKDSVLVCNNSYISPFVKGG